MLSLIKETLYAQYIQSHGATVMKTRELDGLKGDLQYMIYSMYRIYCTVYSLWKKNLYAIFQYGDRQATVP